jgi:hypothetical protein
VISKAARVVVLLLNISSTFSLIAFTIAPFSVMFFASASLASFQPDFAVATAETELRTDVMNVTASAAVYVTPAMMKTAFGQYFGMPLTRAWYSLIVSGFSVLVDMGSLVHERRAVMASEAGCLVVVALIEKSWRDRVSPDRIGLAMSISFHACGSA